MDATGDLEKRIAFDSLERYSGSEIGLFQKKLLLTNFPSYVQAFAKAKNVSISQGSALTVAHSPADQISMINFGIGTTMAALIIDLIRFLEPECALLLGMCAGLRRRYQVGDYLIPVASIRGEGTSDFYFPPQVPALANFFMTTACRDILAKGTDTFHLGISYTSNVRFWEFNKEFKETLQATRAQALELECATIFTAGYRREVSVGALLLISDLPMDESGIKTKESSRKVVDLYSADHVKKGIEIITHAAEIISVHHHRKRQPRPPTAFTLAKGETPNDQNFPQPD
jgi:AMP nucleosidase